MLDVKQSIYNALYNLSIRVNDNPDYETGHKNCPYSIVRTLLEKPTEYKNFRKVNWIFRVDVFSKYKGEKEIKDYYEKEVKRKLDLIQQDEGITYVESNLSIMDDKELGPVVKHGVITISIETMEVE
jgi:hypothetical protein